MNPFMVFEEVADQQAMMVEMMYEDWLTTTSVDGNTVYATMNPTACLALQEMDGISDCLDTWSDMNLIQDET